MGWGPTTENYRQKNYMPKLPNAVLTGSSDTMSLWNLSTNILLLGFAFTQGDWAEADTFLRKNSWKYGCQGSWPSENSVRADLTWNHQAATRLQHRVLGVEFCSLAHQACASFPLKLETKRATFSISPLGHQTLPILQSHRLLQFSQSYLEWLFWNQEHSLVSWGFQSAKCVRSYTVHF